MAKKGTTERCDPVYEYRTAGLIIYPFQNLVIFPGQKRKKLSAIPMKLFTAMISRYPDLVTYEILKTQAWPDQKYVSKNTLKSNMNLLKNSLGEYSLWKNERTFGYRWTKQVLKHQDKKTLMSRWENSNKQFPRNFFPTVFFLMVIGLLLWNYSISRNPIPKKSNISKIEFTYNKEGYLDHVDLLNHENHSIKSIWKMPGHLTNKRKNKITEIAPSLIALQPIKFGNHPIVIESLSSTIPTIHTEKNAYAMDMSEIEATAIDGTSFTFFNADYSLKWIDEPEFAGIGIISCSSNDYLGVLSFWSNDLNHTASLYHPGHLWDFFTKEGFVYIVATLNARNTEEDIYRPSLMKVSLIDILTNKKSQILPFSKHSIPDLAKRRYFSLNNIPPIKNLTYLGFRQSKSLWNAKIQTRGSYFTFFSPEMDAIKNVYFDFDYDLNLIKKYTLEFLWPGTASKLEILSEYGYQEWRDPSWGPWIK